MNSSMQNRNHNVLNDDRIGRLLVKLTLPAFMGMFVITLYNVVDTIFIGHYVGPLGIAGLSIVFPIQMLSMGIGHMMGMGGASLEGLGQSLKGLFGGGAGEPGTQPGDVSQETLDALVDQQGAQPKESNTQAARMLQTAKVQKAITPISALNMCDEILERYGQAIDPVYCRSCNACVESCQHHVDIPEINRCLMYVEGYGDFPLAISNYKELASDINLSMSSLAINSVMGIPATVEYLGRGTIESPWPPNTMAVVSMTETPSFCAKK